MIVVAVVEVVVAVVAAEAVAVSGHWLVWWRWCVPRIGVKRGRCPNHQALDKCGIMVPASRVGASNANAVERPLRTPYQCNLEGYGMACELN